jgi:ATP-dependent Clp protease ATP-binding subunit ClpX
MMMDVMYDIPSVEGDKKVVVTKDTVESGKQPSVEILKKSA